MIFLSLLCYQYIIWSIQLWFILPTKRNFSFSFQLVLRLFMRHCCRSILFLHSLCLSFQSSISLPPLESLSKGVANDRFSCRVKNITGDLKTSQSHDSIFHNRVPCANSGQKFKNSFWFCSFSSISHCEQMIFGP